MAYCQELDYSSEEVRSVAGGFGRYGGGGQQHVVKEKFEEVDTVSRTGGSVQQHVVKEKFEEVDTVSRTGGHHGHHGGHGVVVRETRVEEDFNTCTGEFHERKESFVARAN
ncbi:unnamed protein product [Miscanthus lutarioriparius]|uniref:Uncharacterized protein n=1 Tax=Miscanthus lutarioriparius TaxID=422564 RepID=A0A811NUT9_9POAL|nr:unnamed protein product [Miscanthus lutarioriparius]